MKKIPLLALTAVFVVACGGEHPTVPQIEGMPSLAISDGASGGNGEFFFFPPLVESPTEDPNFDAGAFNEFLAPFVRICRPDSPAPGECAPVPHQSGAVDLPMVVDLTNEWYKVNWKTSEFGLTAGEHYRIQVWVGSTELETNLLGYRDVVPLDGPSVASCTSADDFCHFNNGSTLPIKVRIEDGAFCPLVDGERIPCDTKSFDLAGGVAFNLHDQFRLDVPEQPFSNQGTITFQQCTFDDTADRIDLPTFGPCLEVVNLTPGFDGNLDPNATATVSFCDVDPSSFGLSAAQTANLRVHHFRDADLGGGVEALRPALNCPVSTSALPSSWLQQLASRLVSWVGPRPLAAAVATSGMGGNSLDGMRSKFKIALPAKIDFVSVSDATRIALAGSPLATQAIVTDINGDAVAGATVRWNVDTGAEGAEVVGSVTPSSAACVAGSSDDLVCTTDSTGVVEVSWLLAGDPGINKLTAGGRGIADSREAFNGPRGEDAVVYPLGAFDPFQPIGWAESADDAIDFAYDETYEPLVWGTRLLYTAIGCEEGFGTPNTIDGTMEPGEWDCAAQVSFPVNLSGGSTVDATLYYMNDDTDFHLAVVVPGTGRVNGLRIEWDNNGNAGGREVGDDIWEFDPDGGPADKFVDDKCSTSSQSGCGNDDVDWTGANDTHAAFNNAGGATVYEMSHPLWTSQTCGPVGGRKGCSSGFPVDLQAAADSVRGFFVTLRLGSGAQGNTQWPGFLGYYPIVIK